MKNSLSHKLFIVFTASLLSSQVIMIYAVFQIDLRGYKTLLQIKYSYINSIVKSTVTYRAETWKFKKNLESKLMSMEMDFLRRSARCSRFEKIINNVIREK